MKADTSVLKKVPFLPNKRRYNCQSYIAMIAEIEIRYVTTLLADIYPRLEAITRGTQIRDVLPHRYIDTIGRQTDRQIHRYDRQTDRQIHRYIDTIGRQTDRQTDT